MAELYQDLLKDASESKENGNYFLLTITDLIPNTTYPIEFRYLYKDKTVNDNWSAVKVITTPGESEPNTPKFADGNVDVSQAEKIIITWDGTSDDASSLENYDRVDVYIDGLPFDGTKAAYSFKAPGTAIIPAPAGTYQIALYAISKTGTKSPVSSSVTKIVTAIGTPVTDPEDPDTPTIKSGLASVIVSWNGKKAGGGDLADSGFAGAKVYIGTTSGFTPSDNNWVHTLNFANGSNQVSIGVGTVIDKSIGATLQYGTPYYIKLGTINASGATTGNYVVSDPTNITVSKLPASEISTGILSADASITAGAASGARVVMSGAVSPFIIYGTDGSTKLLEFIGGSTGTLAINGSGNFTGNLSIGSGNSIFKAEPAIGIWLGNSAYASAPFSVSNNGIIKAISGTIGGWTLGSTYLQGNNLKLDTSGIVVGATTSSYFDISPSALTHRNSNGTASGKFTLTLGASPQLTIDGTITVNGSTAATTSDLAGYATTTALSTGLSGKISSGGAATDINSNVTTISGGKIATGQIASTGYSYSSGNFSNAGMQINLDNGVIRSPQFGIDSSGNAYFKGALSAASGTFSGDISSASGTFTGSITSSGSPGGYGSNTLTISGGKLSANAVIYLESDISTGVIDLLASRIELEANTKVTGTFGASGSVTFGGGSTTFEYLSSSGTLRSTYTYGRQVSTSTRAMLIDSSGNFGTAASTRRKKHDIQTYSINSDALLQLKLKSFKYKNDIDPDQTIQYGFIAEEAEELGLNELIQFDSTNIPDYFSYERLPIFLLQLIQEQDLKIKLLESRLDALEA